MRRSSLDLPPLDAEIERLSLGEYVRELDDQGLCVVPPERTGFGPDFAKRGRRALLAVASERTGGRFDLADGCIDELDGPAAAIGQFFVTHLIYAGQEHGPEVGGVFEEIAVNPVKKAMLRHLLGDVHRMSTSNGWIKWRTPDSHEGPFTTPLHADTDPAAPRPWPVATPYVANMNWLLTDYSRDDGAFCYVPESHRRGTTPRFPEAAAKAVPVEAPAGSLVMFHGATWHGSFRKRTPGLRLSIHGLHCRPYYIPQQDYRGNLAAETFARSADPGYLRMLAREDDPWLQERHGVTFVAPKVKLAAAEG